MRPSVRRPSFACALLLAAGCEGTVVVALPPLPPGVQSWVIGVGPDALALHAADADHPVRLEAREDARALELIAYREPLDALGLAPGPLAQAADDAPSTTLPAGVATFVAQLDHSTASAWSSAAAPALLADVRLPATGTCLELRPTVGALPTERDFTWAVSVDRDTVLTGTGEPFAFRLRVGAAPHRLEFVYTSTAHGSASPRSGFRDAGGLLWLGDHDGGLWRAEVSEDALRLTRLVRGSDLGQIRALDGDPADPEQQLFMISTTGTVARFDRDRWAIIDAVPFRPGTDTNNGIAWVGRDALFAAATSWPQVRAVRGEAREDVSISDGEVSITGLTRIGPGQVGVGMSTGVVAHHHDGAWTRLGRGGLALDVYSFVAWQRGFVYGGVYGYVGQWDPDGGFCPVADAPTAGGSVRFLLPFGDALLAIGDGPAGPGNTAYTVLSTRLR